MIDRRAWLAASLGLFAAPLAAPAQAPRVFRVGTLSGAVPTSPAAWHVWQPFFPHRPDRGMTEPADEYAPARYAQAT